MSDLPTKPGMYWVTPREPIKGYESSSIVSVIEVHGRWRGKAVAFVFCGKGGPLGVDTRWFDAGLYLWRDGYPQSLDDLDWRWSGPIEHPKGWPAPVRRHIDTSVYQWEPGR